MVSMSAWNRTLRALILGCALLPVAVSAESLEVQRRCLAWIEAATRSLLPGVDDADLRRYREEYESELGRGDAAGARRVDRDELARRLAGARMVLLGDEHGTAAFQQNAQDVLEAMAAGPGPLTLAIEFVDSRFQHHLDDYLAGKMPAETFKREAYDASDWNFSWKSFRALLDTARDHRVSVVAAEPGRGRSLQERDQAIASRVRSISGRVLVFYGTLHILGKDHLSGLLDDDLIMVGVGPKTYWQVAETFGTSFENVELRPGLVFTNLGDPIRMEWPEFRSLLENFGYQDLEDFLREDPSGADCPCLESRR